SLPSERGAFGGRNDGRLSTFHDGRGGIGCAEVDTDDLRHDVPPVSFPSFLSLSAPPRGRAPVGPAPRSTCNPAESRRRSCLLRHRRLQPARWLRAELGPVFLLWPEWEAAPDPPKIFPVADESTSTRF